MRPLSDGDVYWQRWLGEFILRTHHLPTALGPETFTSTGAPWVPQEWFLSVIVAIALGHGLYFYLTLLFSIIPVAILYSIYVRARTTASPEAIAIVLLTSGIALEASFGVRAQVLGWGCFAAFLFFLQRRDGWFYATVPTVALWANFHASAALAPAFLVARIVGEMLDDGWLAPAVTRDLRILPFTLLALLCTPLGWHLPAYSLMLATSPIRHFIQEWQPSGFTDMEFVLGSLPLALFIVAGNWREMLRNKRKSIPLLMLFVAMLTARRHVPIFAIAAAPCAAIALDCLVPGLRKVSARIAALEPAAIVSACAAVGIAAGAYVLAQRASDPRALANAITSIAADGRQHRLLCENFSSCSMALDYPSIRVYMDGRCDPFPLPVWQAYMAAIRVEPSWRTAIDRYDVDSVLATRGTPFAKAMGRELSWHETFSNDAFVVFSRGPNRDISAP